MFVDPVKEITLTSGCWTKASPAFDPRPQQRFTTPSGRPASWKICRKKFIFSYSALFFSRQLFFFVKWKKNLKIRFFVIIEIVWFCKKTNLSNLFALFGAILTKNWKQQELVKLVFAFWADFPRKKFLRNIRRSP